LSAIAEEPASDLKLSTFFTEGWDQPWAKRSRGDNTPDMSLLRTQSNFPVQLFRLDTFLETDMTSPKLERSELATAIVEYAVSRRFMPALFVTHQWLEERDGQQDNGITGGVFGRFHLLETATASYAMNIKMVLPNQDLGEHRTIWSYALAGWHDLAPLGLGRTGLYWHVQHEIDAGPHAKGTFQNAATYALSLASTWTLSSARLGNLSTFVEAYGRTLLDGDHSGRTSSVLTPGLRCTFAHQHILMLGYDIPLTEERAYQHLFRLTWITNF
jgi:hypothetical protein